MPYIKVARRHDRRDEPIVVYSELDDNRRETRKVEIFGRGPAGYASGDRSSGSTTLRAEAVPDLSAMPPDPKSRREEISKREFEEVWRRATRMAPGFSVIVAVELLGMAVVSAWLCAMGIVFMLIVPSITGQIVAYVSGGIFIVCLLLTIYFYLTLQTSYAFFSIMAPAPLCAAVSYCVLFIDESLR